MIISDIQGTVELHNGIRMPYLGLGTWRSRDGREVINSVHWALEAGYRHIDTAAIYQNETGIGEAIRSGGVARQDIFLVSKVWNGDQGYASTLKAFDTSLQQLGTDYLDLYLIHWPVKGKYRETWRALEQLYADGRVRAIGVSNFLKHHLEDLMAAADIVPMVNQVEFHPRLQQASLMEFCKTHNIRYEAWSPLMQGRVTELKSLRSIAEKYGKTFAQVVLRWNLQKGIVTIPKSVHPERIRQNAELFDFSLAPEDIKEIDGLDNGIRVGPDPDSFDF